MSKSKVNGKPARIDDPRASIRFSPPVHDARGELRHELFEDEARWRMIGYPLVVGISPDGPPSAIEVPGRPRGPSQQLAHLVPMYEITQLLESGQAVVFQVPATSAVVRQPMRLIDVRERDGSESKRLVTPAQLAEIEKRQAMLAAPAAKGEPS